MKIVDYVIAAVDPVEAPKGKLLGCDIFGGIGVGGPLFYALSDGTIVANLEQYTLVPTEWVTPEQRQQWTTLAEIKEEV